jgi:hypothetical protein
MTQDEVAFLAPVPQQIPVAPDFRSFLAPLVLRRSAAFVDFAPLPPANDRTSLRARNKIAAQKLRKKKEGYLQALEDANDALRAEPFRLWSEVRTLTVQNSVLEDELAYFQSLMRRMMNQGK